MMCLDTISIDEYYRSPCVPHTHHSLSLRFAQIHCANRKNSTPYNSLASNDLNGSNYGTGEQEVIHNEESWGVNVAVVVLIN